MTWQCKQTAPHKPNRHPLPFASVPPVSQLELGDPPRPKLRSRIIACQPRFHFTKTHRLSASLTYLWTSGRWQDLGWGFAPVWTCFWPLRWHLVPESSRLAQTLPLSHWASAARERAARSHNTRTRAGLSDRVRFFYKVNSIYYVFIGKYIQYML